MPTLSNDPAPPPSTAPPATEPSDFSQSNTVTAIRSLFGGTLMGLANLVPGISGGTMLLAAGIYPTFIESISDLTRLRFRLRSLLVLACVAAAAGLAILLFAGTLKELVLDQRWVMYSLFIGLTLGGVPVVWRMVRSASTGLWVGAALAFAVMVVLAVLQANGVMGTGDSNFLTLLIAGLAGASAMILPGLSGGYILLLMGQYVPILAAVDLFKEAIQARDVSAAIEPALTVMLPLGLGVICGILIVGNLLKWLLHRFEKPTLGVLLGLLVGSVVGLWPFQAGVLPRVGDIIKGQTVTPEMIDVIKKEDWLVIFFQPSAIQILSSVALIVVGFAITRGVSVLGRERES